MNKFFTIIFSFFLSASMAQTTVDFENFQMDADTFMNGVDANGGFSVGNVYLPNNYNPQYNSFTGWAISNSTDTTTPGFNNQFSSITASGYDNSSNFAVAYVPSPITLNLVNDALGEVVNGFYINNGTYGYLSMRDGDSFAKKFGGLTGDDPDYLLLTIKAYYGGVLSTTDSINFYMADYRFSDNTQDYIVNEWTYVDLTSLGNADSLQFEMFSTDEGNYGINTPTYFLMDNLTTSDGASSVSSISDNPAFNIFPNPATEYFVLENLEGQEVDVLVFNLLGQKVYENQFSDFQKIIDIGNYAKGSYLVRIHCDNKISTELIIKQ